MFRRRRSEGVASPRKDEGDLARDQGDWARAAEAYQAHLQHAPEDFDIWVQLGHARKEEGRYADALVAYSRARRLKPRDHDLLLNLGHLHKRMGHLEAAASFYEQSAGLGNPHARDELTRVATPPRTTASPLQRAAPDAPRPAHQPPQPPEWPRLRAGPDNWPPERLDGFWITQTLRDFIIHGYGEAAVPYYWFLCSVMARRRDKPETFPESEECAQILDRVKTLSAELARSDGPLDATVIIPVFNNFLDTLLCLSTVLETAGERRFEVVVADDGSSDATASLIPTLGGVVRYLRQPQNLGFLRNCNVAAETARGAHVVLLNNDTLVLPAWLDRLLAPFEAFPSVGLTGSKLINWDGTLQEAGGIFWDNGSAWNFGRGSDARAPEFNYLKDVDYCSGAAIAVPTALWRELGGFDEAFLPAYCEDSDLAFRVRAAGYRTVLNPSSSVIHHEGRSHGRDLTTGIKAYQVANQAKLAERWRDVLRRDHLPHGKEVLRARDRTKHARHVLFIDHYVPQWDRDAGSRSIYQYIRLYQELGCAITFWPDNLHHDRDYASRLQDLGVEVIYGPKFRDGFDAFWTSRKDLYDAVFLSRPNVAEKYLPTLRAGGRARILYYGHDLHFRRMEAEMALHGRGNPEDIARTRESEIAVCRQCDVIFYPSPEEVAAVRREVNADRRVLANPVFIYDADTLNAGREKARRIGEDKASRDGSPTLMFVGGFNHSPNVEGIIWFVREVMPLISREAPGVRLQIAGSNPPGEVLDLSSERVEVLGFVTDSRLQALYDSASVVVAPLRFGAGVKGKVIEAMARGAPVATTSVGAQGIASASGLMFLGDTPEALAQAVLQALEQREEARTRALAALDFISNHYSAQALKTLFAEVSFPPAPAGPAS